MESEICQLISGKDKLAILLKNIDKAVASWILVPSEAVKMVGRLSWTATLVANRCGRAFLKALHDPSAYTGLQDKPLACQMLLLVIELERNLVLDELLERILHLNKRGLNGAVPRQIVWLSLLQRFMDLCFSHTVTASACGIPL